MNMSESFVTECGWVSEWVSEWMNQRSYECVRVNVDVWVSEWTWVVEGVNDFKILKVYISTNVHKVSIPIYNYIILIASNMHNTLWVSEWVSEWINKLLHKWVPEEQIHVHYSTSKITSNQHNTFYSFLHWVQSPYKIRLIAIRISNIVSKDTKTVQWDPISSKLVMDSLHWVPQYKLY